MTRETLTPDQRRARTTRTREIRGLLASHLKDPETDEPLKLRGDFLAACFADFAVSAQTPNLAILDGSIVAEIPAQVFDGVTRSAQMRRRMHQVAEGIETGKYYIYAELSI